MASAMGWRHDVPKVVEEPPGAGPPGTISDVNEDINPHGEIRNLCDSGAYPPRRRTRETSDGTQTQL